jgi:hypothetical protein
MLFDLRSRGRRSTVRVVYIGLAILIGLGLVGFGIGGGFGGGGIFSGVSGNEGSTGGKSFADEVKKYQRQTAREPRNAAAWEGLTKALLHEPGGVEENGQVNQKGREQYHRASQAWSSYLALAPAKPNSELAQLMVTVYGEGGLDEPAKAVQALQIVVTARPTSAHYWSLLSIYAYKARNVRVGDLAATKAVAFSPANSRKRVASELAEVRKDPFNEKTYTTTTNGKTYAVKKAPNGTFTGTEIKKTPPPATATTTTKK